MSSYAEPDDLERLVYPVPESVNRTLVIGNIERWKAEGRAVPPLDGFRFVDIDQLSEEVVSDTAPDIILSPLVADNFDAVDVADKLIALNFKGRYRAISEPIPDTDLIKKEVRQFAPQLDFDLLLMPHIADGDDQSGFNAV